jgi:hypothetical protein
MRKSMRPLLPGLVAVVGALLLLPGCLKDHIIEKYQVLTPVYTLKSAVLAGMNSDPATPVSQPGQLYVKGSYIFLNDPEKGIHVIDNSDPSHPVQTAFLNIPGNLNIGIRNNILYADMYADVLAIDISNIHQVKVVGSLRNFFSSRIYNSDTSYIVTNWIVKDTSFVVVPSNLVAIPGTRYYGYGGAVPGGGDLAYAASSSSTGQPTTGTAGSEAVMTMVGDYLYAIPEEHSLGVIHVADSSNPTQTSEGFAGYDLETIFPIQDKLLLGSKEGVFAYSIADPAQPTQIGEFTHGTACDPVIANANYAFITLHAGTACGGSANELDIVDASNIASTSLIKSYPMTSPTGLCLDGSLLFVCDQSVVKVFDVSDVDNLKLLSAVPVSNPNDVIAANHVMMVVTTDGLYQFDYTDPGNIHSLSYIPAANFKP